MRHTSCLKKFYYPTDDRNMEAKLFIQRCKVDYQLTRELIRKPDWFGRELTKLISLRRLCTIYIPARYKALINHPHHWYKDTMCQRASLSPKSTEWDNFSNVRQTFLIRKLSQPGLLKVTEQALVQQKSQQLILLVGANS